MPKKSKNLRGEAILGRILSFYTNYTFGIPYTETNFGIWYTNFNSNKTS